MALRHSSTQSTWALRALRRLDTQALELLGTCTRTLKVLSHSGTWALKALYLADSKAFGNLKDTQPLGHSRHSGTQVTRALGRLGARILEALYLVDSMVCAKKTKTFYLFIFKKSLINLRYVTYLKLNIKMKWIFLK